MSRLKNTKNVMVRYIFVDDAVGGEQENLEPLIDNVEYGVDSEIQIDAVYPDDFGDQRKRLGRENPDGVILDLRLDEFAPSKEEERKGRTKQDYRALGLAQEIRTRATEGNVGEFPIVLWSYDSKLKRSYTKDDTGHDLFDLKCLKEDLRDIEKAGKIATRLLSLSEGYEKILDTRSRKGGPGAQFYKFLGFDSDPGFLDPRILAYFEGRDTPIPAHEYARFILTQLLESSDHLKHPLEISGPLIPEDILAARLGVDIEESEGWNRVLNSLPEEIRYNGPFSEGWERWWASPLEEWWKSLPNYEGSLRHLGSGKRVEILREALDVNGLVAATPIVEGYSSEFWTVCQGSDLDSVKDPLDPIDGFPIDRKNEQSWQDELYISEERAIRGVHHEKGYQIDPLEKKRLENLKQKRREN
jgi:hypothetical protein